MKTCNIVRCLAIEIEIVACFSLEIEEDIRDLNSKGSCSLAVSISAKMIEKK